MTNLSPPPSPKVSILIPAYNAMEYLPATINSVLSQTYRNFEVVVVNDGSTDNVEAWINSLPDRRVRLVSQPNQGLASARNTGLNHAKGDYIAFIDADDIWLPNKLERQVHLLDTQPEIGLVYTWIALIDGAGKPQGKLRKNYAKGDVWVPLTTHNIVECGSVALVRRECFDKVGLFDESLPLSCSEDWDMWLRIAAHYSFGLVAKPLVQYRCHANNLSSRWQAMEKSFEIVLKKAFEAAPEAMQGYKNRSYGFAKLRVAWKALQHSGGDYETAVAFEREAIAYYPAIRRTREYLRFKTALVFVQLFGLQPYTRCRQLAYQMKGQGFYDLLRRRA